MPTPEPYYAWWESVDGLSSGEIRTTEADPPYPAMVSLDLDLGSTLLAEDAKKLAAHLGAAADITWLANRAAFPKATHSRPERDADGD